MDRHITIAVDLSSWIVTYKNTILEFFQSRAFSVKIVHKIDSLQENSDVYLLGFYDIVPKSILEKFKVFVVHESDLPYGRGWSPLTWQIIEGRAEIPMLLIKAVPQVDAGPIVARTSLILEGHELIDEIRELQIKKSLELIFLHQEYRDALPEIQQIGKPTYFRRRTAVDSQLDTGVPLLEQFNLLRVVDNLQYPAYFFHQGYKYILRIEKSDDE